MGIMDSKLQQQRQAQWRQEKLRGLKVKALCRLEMLLNRADRWDDLDRTDRNAIMRAIILTLSQPDEVGGPQLGGYEQVVMMLKGKTQPQISPAEAREVTRALPEGVQGEIVRATRDIAKQMAALPLEPELDDKPLFEEDDDA